MSNVKSESKAMQELMAKLEEMERALQEKEETIANLASKVKPTSRKKIQYNIVDYLDSKHTELGLNKKGVMVNDPNKEGLPARSAKNVLSYLYGSGNRTPKYHQAINQEYYQECFLQDIREWLLAEHIKPLVIEILEQTATKE